MTDGGEEQLEYSLSRFLDEKRDFEKQIDLISDLHPLDSLLDLCHSSALHQRPIPKCSAARYVHGIDLLNALNCYSDIVSLHRACAQKSSSNASAISHLLDAGADVNLCNERGLTAFECFAGCERRTNRLHDCVRRLFEHVHRLAVVGLEVHPQNRRQYEVVRARADMRQFVEQQLRIDYEDELARKLNDDDRQLSLRDALLLGGEEIEDEESSRFPKLWCLVKLRRRQARSRREWRPLLVDALRLLTRRKLPGNCVDVIIRRLANYDLANVLAVAFDACLRDYKSARRARRKSSSGRLSAQWSPRKMLPRI